MRACVRACVRADVHSVRACERACERTSMSALAGRFVRGFPLARTARVCEQARVAGWEWGCRLISVCMWMPVCTVVWLGARERVYGYVSVYIRLLIS